jgi:hypothetical protein
MIPLMDDIEYLSLRERQERAAAKRAMGPAARAAHQELAQLYATKIVLYLGQQPALRAA